MRRLLTSMSVALVLVLALSAISIVSAQGHPKIRAAISALKDARTEMRNAKDEFCGHKADAIKATDYAITQLQEALQYAGASRIQNDLDKANYVKVSMSEPYQRFPRIRAALDSLKAARDDMQNANNDFHGHKQKALDATNDAINQLQQAIECAK